MDLEVGYVKCAKHFLFFIEEKWCWQMVFQFSIDYFVAWGIYNYLLEGMLGNCNLKAYGNDEGP